MRVRKLYKYVKADICQKILNNGTIRFTPPNEFNDPFELLPAKKEYTYEMNKKFQDYASRKIGILSLTEKRNDLVMWSHYAHDHKGVVIEFSVNNEFMNIHDFGNKEATCQKVKYEEKRCWAPDEWNQKEKYDFILKLGITKSTYWENEKEWRGFCEIESKNNSYLIKFPPKIITGIIYGCRIDEKKKKEISDIIKQNQKYSRIKEYQAEIHDCEYKLSIKPMVKTC